MPCPPPPLSKTGAGYCGGRASRRFRRPIWTLLVLLLGAWGVAAEEVATQPVVAAARRAGLRVLEGRHLILITDRPVRADDGVEDLPQIFDAAFAVWCDHFQVAGPTVNSWRAVGCLMVDRQPFQAAGLLPTDGTIPPFRKGFCDRNRFWLIDHPNPAYRRHLLLHEGVHACSLTLRGLSTPVWYTEGIAELLATHRLRGGRFEPTPIPHQASDVEQLGRIEKLLSLRHSGTVPGLKEVLATPPDRHHALASYAASWAAVAMLSGHPTYAKIFRELEAGPLDANLTQRLEEAPGWNAAEAARDFDAFTAEVDYGYDFSTSAIDWSPGSPLATASQVSVAADRGWQNSGWSLRQGDRLAVVADGRCRVGAVPQGPIETEPEGISLAWYRGRPVGRLLVAQWLPAASGGGRPQWKILAEGSGGECVAVADGPVYCKINESPGALADNAGTLSVILKPRN